MNPAAPPNPEVLAHTRRAVQDVLLKSDAFRALSPVQRKDLAYNMVKVAAYIAGGERGDSTPSRAHISGALAGPPARGAPRGGPQSPPQPAPKPHPDTASADMAASGAAANREAGSILADDVQKVNFPKFVADLVHGVFQAIVDSSIKQMEAYADLVKNVAKSVDQYMKDNVTENQARDYLVDKYPNHLELNIDNNQPQIRPKADADSSTMPNFFADLGLPAPAGASSSIDADTAEQQLVPAARKRLAMDRQQMLATMVLMGVNRLIVTDGSIKASVLFDFKASDKVNKVRAQSVDVNSQSDTTSSDHPGLTGWLSGYRSRDNTTSVTVASTSQKNDTSSSTIDSHQNLAGEVNIRFRSETFPLDKMAEMIQPDLKEKIQGNTPAGAAKAVAPAPAGAPLPAPPPPPTLPPLPPIGQH